MHSKPKAAAVTGPYCDRCSRPIQGVPIPVGLKDRCVNCLLRPYVLIQIMQRLQEQDRRAACPTN